MDQRRLVIAFLISLVVIVAYERLVLSRYKKEPAYPLEEIPAVEAPPPAPAAAPPGELAAPRGDERVVTIETDSFEIVITPLGARLADVRLKAYRRTVARDSEPLDLVQQAAVLPGTLQLGPGVSDAGIVYQPDRYQLFVHRDGEGEVVFTAELQDGQSIEKRYRFRGGGHVFDVTAVVGSERQLAAVGLVLTPLPAESPNGGYQSAIALADNKLVEKAVNDLPKEPTSVADAAWAGFAAQYFLAVAMPRGGTAPVLLTAGDTIPIVRIDAPLVDRRAEFNVYMGPKDRAVLSEAGHELDRALDFGWFWFVAIPLLHALRAIQKVTGNYGIAIIVLTALVKVLTAPLTQTTFRNMREMQKIQPQMAKLRERFKNDPAALQKEMMELYRRHRVNPFSGCLPMVLQIPIFIGLYNTLSHAIELRHAPFALWINDLSAPDRLMIAGIGIPVLTLLMGASMFLQQWLTPQQGDPMQQRMMMFMPLIFTFMFINFPAGLVLYWLVNNVLTIGQQYYMMRSTK